MKKSKKRSRKRSKKKSIFFNKPFIEGSEIQVQFDWHHNYRKFFEKLRTSKHSGLPKGWKHGNTQNNANPLTKSDKWDIGSISWFYGPKENSKKAVEFLKIKYGKMKEKELLGPLKITLRSGKRMIANAFAISPSDIKSKRKSKRKSRRKSKRKSN
jgi:hypothetical protein